MEEDNASEFVRLLIESHANKQTELLDKLLIKLDDYDINPLEILKDCVREGQIKLAENVISCPSFWTLNLVNIEYPALVRLYSTKDILIFTGWLYNMPEDTPSFLEDLLFNAERGLFVKDEQMRLGFFDLNIKYNISVSRLKLLLLRHLPHIRPGEYYINLHEHILEREDITEKDYEWFMKRLVPIYTYQYIGKCRIPSVKRQKIIERIEIEADKKWTTNYYPLRSIIAEDTRLYREDDFDIFEWILDLDRIGNWSVRSIIQTINSLNAHASPRARYIIERIMLRFRVDTSWSNKPESPYVHDLLARYPRRGNKDLDSLAYRFCAGLFDHEDRVNTIGSLSSEELGQNVMLFLRFLLTYARNPKCMKYLEIVMRSCLEDEDKLADLTYRVMQSRNTTAFHLLDSLIPPTLQIRFYTIVNLGLREIRKHSDKPEEIPSIIEFTKSVIAHLGEYLNLKILYTMTTDLYPSQLPQGENNEFENPRIYESMTMNAIIRLPQSQETIEMASLLMSYVIQQPLFSAKPTNWYLYYCYKYPLFRGNAYLKSIIKLWPSLRIVSWMTGYRLIRQFVNENPRVLLESVCSHFLTYTNEPKGYVLPFIPYCKIDVYKNTFVLGGRIYTRWNKQRPVPSYNWSDPAYPRQSSLVIPNTTRVACKSCKSPVEEPHSHSGDAYNIFYCKSCAVNDNIELTTCMVCTESMIVRILKCGHPLCVSCLREMTGAGYNNCGMCGSSLITVTPTDVQRIVDIYLKENNLA